MNIYKKNLCKLKTLSCWICGIEFVHKNRAYRSPHLCIDCAVNFNKSKRIIGKKFCKLNIVKCNYCGTELATSVYNKKRVCSKECLSNTFIVLKGNEPGFKKCNICKLYLPILKFYPEKGKRCKSHCIDCEKSVRIKRKEYLRCANKKYKKTEKGIAKRRAYRKKLREELAPEYLKKLVARYLPISESEIPQEILNVKRAVVELKRALK